MVEGQGVGRGIALKNVGLTLGDFSLSGVDLEVRKGEYVVLTGPNGAGKTVLLKIIAGLYAPESGEVRIGGRDVTDVPPWERGIGYVPQDYALFPNRDVRRNIAFGLEVRKTERKAAPLSLEGRVEATAEMLGVGHLLGRTVEGLSGGERQKVSLARALVIEPQVLLMDEPVSAVDEENRDAICRELKATQRRTKVTTLHVCHNRREAELVADRIFLLKDGALVESQAAGLDHSHPPERASRRE